MPQPRRQDVVRVRFEIFAECRVDDLRAHHRLAARRLSASARAELVVEGRAADLLARHFEVQVKT